MKTSFEKAKKEIIEEVDDNMEDLYDEIDEQEDDDSGHLLLSIGDDGKVSIHKPEDFVEMYKDDAELVKGFIDKNKDAFMKYCAENKTQAKTSKKKS